MSLGIYLHIPFCKQKCLYCDFNSYAGKEAAMDEYCNALGREISVCANEQPVNTIYFGGGTPTFLGASRLTELLGLVKKSFALTEDCEITTECNPGTISREELFVLRQAGFNRLSIGLQSTEDEVLKKLGRIHSLKEFQECFKAARDAGFDNISLDLMYGLPDQTVESWENTLETAIAFHPEHLSCYGLKVEEGTSFAAMTLTLPTDDAVGEMYDICVERLKKAGYPRYEISNFAKPGRESRHNLKYWQCDDFLGLGAGAYSCMDGVRYDNVGGIGDYCRAMNEKKSAIEERMPFSLEDQMSEFCFLGLRTTDGISAEVFRDRFGKEITEVFGAVLKKNLERGTMLYHKGWYRIAPAFFYVSNGILADFV